MKGYRSEVLASVHETALGMTEAGVMTTGLCADNGQGFADVFRERQVLCR